MSIIPSSDYFSYASCLALLLSIVVRPGCKTHCDGLLHNVDRREAIVWTGLSSAGIINSLSGINAHALEDVSKVVLPMETCEGGCNCIRFVAENPSGEAAAYFRAIVDTGSPFLIIPSAQVSDAVLDACFDGEERWWKRLLPRNRLGRQKLVDDFFPLDPKFPPTVDVYGSQQGNIQWRTVSRIKYRDERLRHRINNDNPSSLGLTFGVMDDALSDESGGALVGLVKKWKMDTTKAAVRPSWLEQLEIGNNSDQENREYHHGIRSFSVDSPRKTLTLSSESLIKGANKSCTMRLADLREWGDFVDHYACYIKELYIDDFPVYRSGLIPSGRRICIVFDSGLTGCLFTKSLWDELQQKTGKDLSSLRSVKVDVPTVSGGANAVHSIGSGDGKDKVRNMFYVSPISLDWFDDDTIAPHIVVLGQAFLSLGELSIDITERKVSFVYDRDVI
mmetsp:Transcript_12107/g.15789  ORF Transcript_12107/g.15789 Transcript_12107/m.15789 type:complete len:448 (+) Transcript_12107:63-1406(+)